MKKRFLSMVTALALCLTLLPTAALAEELDDLTPVCTCEQACTAEGMNADCPVCGAEGAAETDCAKYVEPAAEPEEPTGDPEQPVDKEEKPLETPEEKPADEPEDPVSEPEQPAQPTAAERVANMIDALPTAAEVKYMDEDERDATYDAAQEAYDALEELTAEEMAAVTNLAKLTALLEAFTEEVTPLDNSTYSDGLGGTWAVWLNGKDVRKETGDLEKDHYHYDAASHTLTLKNYKGNENGHSYSQSTLSGSIPLNVMLFSNHETCDLTINLVGNNYLGKDDASKYDYVSGTNTETARTAGIAVESQGIFISGTGNLTVNAQMYPILGMCYYQTTTGTVTLNSRLDGMEVGGVRIKSGKFYANCVSNNLYYHGLKITSQIPWQYDTIATGSLIVDKDAEVYVTTKGCDFEGTFAKALDVAGNITVNGKLDVKGDGEKDGTGCRSVVIEVDGQLAVNEGGRVYAYSEGKHKNNGYDGQEAIIAGRIQVANRGYLYAKNYNSDGKAVKITSNADDDLHIKGDDNNSAVITIPTEAKFEDNTIKKSIDGGTTWNAVNEVAISGTALCTLNLKDSKNYQHFWKFYNTHNNGGNAASPGQQYGDVLDLTGGTNGTGFSELKRLDYTLIEGIVVESGHQVVKLNGAQITGRTASTPYITVKSGATLTLLLSGMNYLERTSWDSSMDSLISVEEGGTLNIKLADGAAVNSFLSIVTTGGAIGAKLVDGNEKAAINIQSGTIYTGNYNSNEGYVGGHSTIGDLLCDVNINGGYVMANLDGTLKITGGTIPTGCTYYGTAITVDGGSVGLNFNKDNVTVKNSSNTPVLKTTVQLYNAQKLKNDQTGTWKTIQYFTKYNGGTSYERIEITLPAVLRLDLTKNNAAYKNYGITDLYGTTGDDPELYLYLPADAQADLAALNEIPYDITGYESQVFRANKGEEVKGGTSGKLYLRTLVIGQGIMALRGNPNTEKYYKEVQMSPHYTGEDSDIWYDYDDTVEMTVGAAGDNDLRVQKFGVSILSGTHSITFKRLNVIGGEGQRLELKQDYSRQSTLNLLLDGSCALTANGTDPVVKLGGTLNIAGSYETGGQTVSTNGRLTLKGSGKAFATNYDYNSLIDLKILENALSVKDAMLINECSDSGGTFFTSLSFDNATVIGLGKVRAHNNNITINGGSVDIDVEQDTVKNSNGNTLTKTPFKVANVSDYTKIDTLNITGLPTGATFDDDCVWTDKQGNIYLWLPTGAALESAVIGSETYYPVPDGQGGTTLMTAQAPTFDTTTDTVLSLASGAFTLTATATGSPVPTQQWQKWNGSEWTDVENAKSSTYSGTMTAAMHGEKYRCKAINTVSGTEPPVYSHTFTLFYLPAITAQPANQSVCAGADAAFAVTVESVSGITVNYQWQESTDGTNWTNISSATGSTYTVPATAALDGRQYRCQISCTDEALTGETRYSDTVTLTVVGAPTFSTQPSDAAVKTGGSATFTVEASGNKAISYQWQYSDNGTDWTDISDATGTTYTVSGVTDAMNGRKFRCTAVSTVNSVKNTSYSNTVTLAVVAVPVITAQPASAAAEVGGKASFRVTASGSHSLTYQWQVKKTGQNGIPTGDFTNISGATSPTYTTGTTTRDMSGWLYRCVVTNTAASVSQTVTSAEAELSVYRADSSDTSDISTEQGEHGTITLPKRYGEAGETVRITVEPKAGYQIGTVTVTDRNGKVLKVTDEGGGLFSFVMPSGGVRISATYVPSGTTGGFVDVPADQYYADAVLWAVDSGITGGTDETHFSPYAPCTRAQLAVFLYRYVQSQGEGFTGAWMFRLPFTDVPEWCYEAVAWCYMNDIVKGYDDGTFRPGDTVTRQQMAAILYRFAQAMEMDVSVGADTNILSFQDALQVREYAVEAFQWAVGAGIVQGDSGYLRPARICTRAQIVTMLYRLLGK